MVVNKIQNNIIFKGPPGTDFPDYLRNPFIFYWRVMHECFSASIKISISLSHVGVTIEFTLDFSCKINLISWKYTVKACSSEVASAKAIKTGVD